MADCPPDKVNGKRVSLEEAKRQLLDPPADAPGPSFVEQNAIGLVAAALVLGFFTATPRRLGHMALLGGRALRSPMVRRGLFFLLLNAARKSGR